MTAKPLPRLAAALSATQAAGTAMRDQTVVIHGAGTAGIGIADSLRQVMIDEGLSPDQATARFYALGSKGLLTSDYPGTLRDFQVPYARTAAQVVRVLRTQMGWAPGERTLQRHFARAGLMGFDPKSGAPAWKPPFAQPGTPRSIQPHVVADDQVVVLSDADLGVAMVDLKKESGGIEATKRASWNSRGLKSSFNDAVAADGFLYGFDRNMLACIDLATGDVRWKGRKRYGYGQLLLLAEQRMLLVLSESGEVSLVKASPEKFEEVGSFQGISGKTWNHPVVAHGAIYIRNAEEMARFDSDTSSPGTAPSKPGGPDT